MTSRKSALGSSTPKSAQDNNHLDHTTQAPQANGEPSAFDDADLAYDAYRDAEMRYGDGGCWGSW